MSTEHDTASFHVEQSGVNPAARGDGAAPLAHQRHPDGSHHERRQAKKARARTGVQLVAGRFPIPRDGTPHDQASLDRYVAGQMLSEAHKRIAAGHLAPPTTTPSSPETRKTIEALIAAAGAPPPPILTRSRLPRA